MNPLVLNVAELLRKPGTERPLEVDCLLSDLGIVDDRLPEGPVGLNGRLEVLSDGIVVSATVVARWTGECRRCLEPVGGLLEIPVNELYQVRVSDPEAFPLEHDQLDLRPMVREALLLDVPSAPLCRPDCGGICPVCGGERNETACNCVTVPRDERWSALDALRDDSR